MHGGVATPLCRLPTSLFFRPSSSHISTRSPAPLPAFVPDLGGSALDGGLRSVGGFSFFLSLLSSFFFFLFSRSFFFLLSFTGLAGVAAVEN